MIQITDYVCQYTKTLGLTLPVANDLISVKAEGYEDNINIQGAVEKEYLSRTYMSYAEKGIVGFIIGIDDSRCSDTCSTSDGD